MAGYSLTEWVSEWQKRPESGAREWSDSGSSAFTIFPCLAAVAALKHSTTLQQQSIGPLCLVRTRGQSSTPPLLLLLLGIGWLSRLWLTHSHTDSYTTSIHFTSPYSFSHSQHSTEHIFFLPPITTIQSQGQPSNCNRITDWEIHWRRRCRCRFNSI